MNVTDDLPDAALLSGLAGGDLAALEVLFRRHHRDVRDAAQAVVRDPDLAEDVTHEAFIAAWRGASTFRPQRGPVRAWLCAIARNRALDALRRNSNHKRRVDALAADGPPPPPLTPARIAEAREASRSARAALAQLPAEQRRVVELVYFAGLSQAEVASADGVPLGTVKGRMRLAFSKLRPALADYAAA
jgi:RNA polymerase sigma-70 factor (ECF subfamily)